MELERVVSGTADDVFDPGGDDIVHAESVKRNSPTQQIGKFLDQLRTRIIARQHKCHADRQRHRMPQRIQFILPRSDTIGGQSVDVISHVATGITEVQRVEAEVEVNTGVN